MNEHKTNRTSRNSSGVTYRESLKLVSPPENDVIYRLSDIEKLAQSIKDHGVLEPLVITTDNVIVSGNRRYRAAMSQQLAFLPVRIIPTIWADLTVTDRYELLREHNQQRVKTFSELAREAAIDANAQGRDLTEEFIARRQKKFDDEIDVHKIDGVMSRTEINKRSRPLLDAAIKIISSYNFPLALRGIHYHLLNSKPLKDTSKPNSHYQNTIADYQKLSDLLTRARIFGEIPFESISDETRVRDFMDHCFDQVGSYIQSSLDGLFTTYWRNLLQTQEAYLVIFIEKHTVQPLLMPIAQRYTIPVVFGRGQSSITPRYEIAKNYFKSGKDRLVILALTDRDPAGEAIFNSFGKSLRDDFGISESKLTLIRVAVTTQQVVDYNLPISCEAKKKSPTYKEFVREHGNNVYEIESIPPEILQRDLENKILSVIDVDAYNREVEMEKAEGRKLQAEREAVIKYMTEYG